MIINNVSITQKLYGSCKTTTRKSVHTEGYEFYHLKYIIKKKKNAVKGGLLHFGQIMEDTMQTIGIASIFYGWS